MTTERAGIIERELGPFEGVERVNGVAFDGERLWCATNDALRAVDPKDGALSTERIAVEAEAEAGTAYDGRHLYQLSGHSIQKIDPANGRIVATIASPCEDRGSGMAWAEGSLWVGEYREGRIHRIDPETGALRATIESDRFVTGITWVDDQLWHGGQDEQGACSLVHVDAETGEVFERVHVGGGVQVSGMATGPDGRIFCGGGRDGRVRVVRTR